MKFNFFKKHISFTNLFIGQVVSVFGSLIYSYYVGFYLLDITNSIVLFGAYISFLMVFRLVMGYVSSVIVERLDKVKIIVYSDLILGILMLLTGLILLVVSPGINNTVYILIMINIISTFLNSLFNPAVNSLYPLLLNGENLKIGYSLRTAMNNAQNIVTIMISGIIFNYVSVEFVLIFNGISFFMSAMFERKIVALFTEDDESLKKREKFSSLFVGGFKYIIKDKTVSSYLILSSILNIVSYAYSVILIRYMLLEHLKLNEIYFSIAVVAYSVANIIASKYVIKAKRSNYSFIKMGLIVQILSLVPLLFISMDFKSYSLVLGLISVSCMNYGMTIYNIPMTSKIMQEIDKNYLSRSIGVLTLTSGLTAPLSNMIFSLLLSTYDFRISVLFAIVVFIFGYVYLLKNKYLVK